MKRYLILCFLIISFAAKAQIQELAELTIAPGGQYGLIVDTLLRGGVHPGLADTNARNGIGILKRKVGMWAITLNTHGADGIRTVWELQTLSVNNGTNWQAVNLGTPGALLSSNNLSDLANAATARTNLGLSGTGYQLWSGSSVSFSSTIPNTSITGLGTLATQNGSFSGTHSGNSSGTNTGDQTITLTGDVTGSGTGSFAATIAQINGITKNYYDPTSSIQTQLNGKMNNSGGVFTGSIQFGAGTYTSGVPSAFTTSAQGLILSATTGTSRDFMLIAPGGTVAEVPTGTPDIQFDGNVQVGTSLKVVGGTTLNAGLNGLLKATAGVISAAASGTDFLPVANPSSTGVFTNSSSTIATIRGIISRQTTNDALGGKFDIEKDRLSGVITTGDVLGAMQFSGFDGTNYTPGAKILVTSIGTIGSAIVPATMAIQTANASGTLVTAINIDQLQNITFPHYTTNGGLIYTNGTGVVSQTGAGSATTLLHGGTSPAYSAVALGTDISGVLPIANGGTGSGTQPFVDLSTNQTTIAGNKTFTGVLSTVTPGTQINTTQVPTSAWVNTYFVSVGSNNTYTGTNTYNNLVSYGGTITGSGGFARAVNYTTTLTPGANNDSEIALDLTNVTYSLIGTGGPAFFGAAITTPGSGYVNGNYSVTVTGTTGTGATLVATVSGGSVTALSTQPNTGSGSGWHVGDTFTIPNASLGGTGSGFLGTVTVTTFLGVTKTGLKTNDIQPSADNIGNLGTTLNGLWYQSVNAFTVGADNLTSHGSGHSLNFTTGVVNHVGTFFFGSGGLQLSGAIDADLGYRLDVNGAINGRGTGLHITGETDGMLLSQSLKAVANNDVIAGVHINNTFDLNASAIRTLGTITGGSGYTNQTAVLKSLTGGSGTGATANFTVAGGVVTAVTIVSQGTGYTTSDVLSCTTIGSGTGFSIPVTAVGLTGVVPVSLWTAGGILVGGKINVTTSGSAQSFGSATLVSGTVTVSTTAVTANSKIILTYGTTSGTIGIPTPGTITAGTSFVINSLTAGTTSTLNTADNSTVTYWIVN
jgi:hypothetical protein